MERCGIQCNQSTLHLINTLNHHSIAHKVKCCCNKDEISNDDVNNLGFEIQRNLRVCLINFTSTLEDFQISALGFNGVSEGCKG